MNVFATDGQTVLEDTAFVVICLVGLVGASLLLLQWFGPVAVVLTGVALLSGGGLGVAVRRVHRDVVGEQGDPHR